jgi:hypothetical protein
VRELPLVTPRKRCCICTHWYSCRCCTTAQATTTPGTDSQVLQGEA